MTDSPEFRRQQAEMQELRGFLENTMTEKKQPEALRLADALYNGTYLLSQDRDATAVALRTQHALIEELREAVEAFVKYDDSATQDGYEFMTLYANAVDKSRAALAKAEAQS